MSPSSGSDDARRLVRERDLYLRLLELGRAEELRSFVGEALAVLVDTVGAERGYLEIYGADPAVPVLSVAQAMSEPEIEGVRARLSQGIVADALATGRTISTASAVDDPRYAANESVQAKRIRAVLCAPLALAGRGGDRGTIGVIYLEGRKAPGPFPAQDQELVEVAARHVGPHADRLVAQAELAKEVDHTADLRAKLRVEGIAGRSRALADVFRQVLVAAPVPVTVLLRGESGTGKSALARALHLASPRASGPFVEVNVAALPDTLFESELFGAEKGAHSTATTRIVGKAEAASGGTLFLDEIGELSLPAQAKLLTFLQSKSFLRLGGSAPVHADVRVLAATNADLEEAVQAKRFREDLYYRLNVLEIVVPPLRERREDVVPIADEIAARLAEGRADQRIPLSRAAARALADAEWPGNVRQLENTIARGWARALADGARHIDPHHVFPDRPARTDPEAPAGYQEATRRFQLQLLEETLSACRWNVSEAARRLDLSRSHLNDLIRSHGLVRKRGDG